MNNYVRTVLIYILSSIKLIVLSVRSRIINTFSTMYIVLHTYLIYVLIIYNTFQAASSHEELGLEYFQRKIIIKHPGK